MAAFFIFCMRGGRQLNSDQYPQLDPFSTGLKSACPRCGQGQLFSGYMKLKPKCTACGLDYSFVDTGEGPAVLVMLVVGFVILGSALWLDSQFALAIWLQILIWLPVSVLLSLFLLRKMKAVMIALQYRHKAHEGKIDRD